jgi:hypothetical protein
MTRKTRNVDYERAARLEPIARESGHRVWGDFTNKLVTLTADSGLLLTMVMAVPFAVLLVGIPIVLIIQLFLEIIRHLT